MSQCGDYEDIHFYVINVFYGIVIADYFLPFKKITLYVPVNSANAISSAVLKTATLCDLSDLHRSWSHVPLSREMEREGMG